MKKLFIITAILFLLSSCTHTRITVGDGPVGTKGKTKIYSKTKQMRLFYGLIPAGYSQPAIPEDKNFQIKTSKNFTDALISIITLNIVSSETVKIIVKR